MVFQWSQLGLLAPQMRSIHRCAKLGDKPDNIDLS